MPNQKYYTKCSSRIPTLDDLLDTWTVEDQWENNTCPPNWFAVANNKSIVAHFEIEADAFAFRLMKINHILNASY